MGDTLKTLTTRIGESDEITNKLMTQMTTRDGELLSLMEKFTAMELRLDFIDEALKDGTQHGGDLYHQRGVWH